MNDDERLTQGMRRRRQVLGEGHVDRAEAAKDAFDEDFQSFITRYAWGEIWSREGLSQHTRSLLTIALMVAANRDSELRAHVRAAVTNGVTINEIKEVLMHCAIYCGLPAANSAFRTCREVLTELGIRPDHPQQ